MTVIAWDGKILAADRRADVNGTASSVIKIRRLLSGNVVAFTGNLGSGLLLCDWYERGARKEEWPSFQSTNDWSRLIVASKDGLVFYEGQRCPIKILDPFTAFGTGRDVALGALAMGANAIKAVEIACQYQSDCGNGCDWFVIGA